MKKVVKRHENGVSFLVEFQFDAREATAVAHCWSDFTFHLERGEGWGVTPEEGYGGAAFVDGNYAPGGKFINGVWKGFIYPNGRKNIPNIDDSIEVLSASIKKPMDAVLRWFEAFEKSGL